MTDDTFARAAAEDFFAEARRVSELRRERWGNSDGDSMTRLVRSFPVLEDAAGVDPWNAGRFLRWACAPDTDLCSSALHAVRFVLQVWNCRRDWRATAKDEGLGGGHLAPFNLVEACSIWDNRHRVACLAWIEAPFFP